MPRYSGRSLHHQHEEMKMIDPIRNPYRRVKPAPKTSWLKTDVVQATLREVVMSLAIGCMLAGCVAAVLH
jgi:hypothetical protein